MDSHHLRRNAAPRLLLLLGVIVMLPDRQRGRPAFAQPAGGRAKNALKVGRDVYGKVSEYTNNGLLVSVEGTNVTAFVHISQLSERNDVKHPSECHQIGDKVKARVVSNGPAMLEVSLVKARRKRATDFIVGQEVNGSVTAVVAAGAFVDIGAESDSFLHRSQVQDGKFVRDVRDYLQVGQTVDARIRRRDDENGKLELSMLPAYKVVMPLQRGLNMDDLMPGQEMGGVVTGVRSFGCFVDVGAEGDGLIHIRNLNGGIVDKIDTIVKIGDALVVRVKKMAGSRLELELAAPLPRLPPVDGFLKVPEDEWLEGIVEGTLAFGVLVELTPPAGGPKVTALLRSKEIDDPGDMYPGNTVKVRVDEVDVEQKRVFVSQQARKETPRTLTEDELRAADVLPGIVKSVQRYGAFVDVGAEKIGLVPIQKINGGIVPDIYAIIQSGDKVQCRVTGFNDGKLELGLAKPPPRLPSVEPFIALKEKWVKGTMSGRGPSGTYVALTPPEGGPAVTALLFGKTRDLRKGDPVEVRIFSVDTEMQQVFVSTVDRQQGPGDGDGDGDGQEAPPPVAQTSARATRAAMFGIGM